MPQISYLVFIWLSVHYFGTEATQSNTSRESFAVEIEEARDQVFINVDLVFVSQTTKKNCALLCLAHDGCASFTFTSSSISTGTCQGYQTVLGWRRIHKTVPGTQYFVKEWLTKACTSDSEVLVASAECFRGRLVCRLGYYYSQKPKYCIESCRLTELQPQMVRYPGVSFNNNNIGSFSTPDPDNCAQECSSHPQCISAVFDHSVDTCYLKNATKRTARDSDWVGGPPYNDDLILFQKTCIPIPIQSG